MAWRSASGALRSEEKHGLFDLPTHFDNAVFVKWRDKKNKKEKKKSRERKTKRTVMWCADSLSVDQRINSATLHPYPR